MAASNVHNIFERVDAAKADKARLYKMQAEQREKEAAKTDKAAERLTPEKLYLEGVGDQLFAQDEPIAPDKVSADTTDVELALVLDDTEIEEIEQTPKKAEVATETATEAQKADAIEKKGTGANPIHHTKVQSHQNKTSTSSAQAQIRATVPKAAQMIDKGKTCEVYLMHRYHEESGTGVYSLTFAMSGEVIHLGECGVQNDPDEYMLKAAIKMCEIVLEHDAWSAVVYTQNKDVAVALDRMARKLQPGPAIDVRRKYVSIAQELARNCSLSFASTPPTTLAMLTDATLNTLSVLHRAEA